MFSHQIIVRGFHCDMFGHVNNARYLEFLEETRWEWLNSINPNDLFLRKNQSFVVVSITIHYKWPSVLNDALIVTVELKHTTNKTATVRQTVTRKKDEKLIAEADVTFAVIDNATGRAVVLDDEMKNFLLKEH